MNLSATFEYYHHSGDDYRVLAVTKWENGEVQQQTVYKARTEAEAIALGNALNHCLNHIRDAYAL